MPRTQKKSPKKHKVRIKSNKIPKRTVAPKDLPAELDKILTEQAKQKVISQATEVAEVVYQNKISQAITEITRRGLDREVLIHELMTGAVALNVHMHPDAKLNYIKTALVLDGYLEGTSLGRRIAPLDDVPDAQSSVYASIFNRPTQPHAPQEIGAQAAPVGLDADDLYPVTSTPSIPSLSTLLPTRGENIYESQDKAKPETPGVITVEIG